MIGHCLGAAGGLEAIATIKAITTGWLHPTINQDVLSWLATYHINQFLAKQLN
jgi:3-oxoacyl-[acyl-carrier-protein] synthase II